MVIAPHQCLLVGFHARPLVDDVVAEVEVGGHVDAKMLIEVLIALEVDARTILFEDVIHNKLPLCFNPVMWYYSAMTVTNRAGTSLPQRWPCGMDGLK